MTGKSDDIIDNMITHQKQTDNNPKDKKEPNYQTYTNEALSTNTAGYNGKSTIKSRFIWDLYFSPGCIPIAFQSTFQRVIHYSKSKNSSNVIPA